MAQTSQGLLPGCHRLGVGNWRLLVLVLGQGVEVTKLMPDQPYLLFLHGKHDSSVTMDLFNQITRNLCDRRIIFKIII